MKLKTNKMKNRDFDNDKIFNVINNTSVATLRAISDTSIPGKEVQTNTSYGLISLRYAKQIAP